MREFQTGRESLTRGEKQSAPDDDDADGPACHSCRKRRAKCSREQPCRQCVKLNTDCMYDEKRQRPGMHTGAIEALNQRLTTLEQIFLGSALLLRPLLGRLEQQSEHGNESDLAELTDALRLQLLGVARDKLVSEDAMESN